MIKNKKYLILAIVWMVNCTLPRKNTVNNLRYKLLSKLLRKVKKQQQFQSIKDNASSYGYRRIKCELDAKGVKINHKRGVCKY